VKPTLRPYQGEGLDAIATSLQQGANRVLLKAPTGTGKTVTFAAILEHPPIKAWLQQFPENQRRMLVIAHREELLDQAAAKIAAANPGLTVSVEQADRYAHAFSDVVVASIQTLAARNYVRLRRLLRDHAFRIVIIDEAHHAAAATYRTALAHLGFLPLAAESTEDNAEAATFEDVAKMEELLRGWDARAPKDRLLVGVTATPNRSDAIGLGCVFQTIAYSYGLRDAINDGWLVPIVAWSVSTDACLDEVRTNRGEFNQRELADTVNTPTRNGLAVAAWIDQAYGRQTLAFTVDVQHAHDLAEAFRRAGVDAKAVSGETPKEERRELLERFRRGQLTVLANCMVLTEGTDLPTASCILHAKPTKSATLYEQMTGRGLRVHPQDPAGPPRLATKGPFLKPDCVVIDLVDVARKHSLQTAPVLYGLPPKLRTVGDGLEELADEWNELRDKHPNVDIDALFTNGALTLDQFQAYVQRVDTWAIPDLGSFARGRHLEWLHPTPETYRIDYPWADGHEHLTVSQDLIGHWQVEATYRMNGHRESSSRILAAGVTTMEAAASLAEGFIEQERPSVIRMKATNAPWKRNPATPKQLACLRKWNIPHNPRTITGGLASQLMTLWMVRHGRA
jgi:ATP-dependent helicase IRC3